MMLERFRKKAESLGAVCEEESSYSDNLKFDTWHSSKDGDCGLPGCRCSPGLWVTARQGDKTLVAHFGTDWERGGEGYFTKDDLKKWHELVKFAKELTKA